MGYGVYGDFQGELGGLMRMGMGGLRGGLADKSCVCVE